MTKLNEKGICYKTGGGAEFRLDYVYSLVYKEDDTPYGLQY
jgi:hypothetical protein